MEFIPSFAIQSVPRYYSQTALYVTGMDYTIAPWRVEQEIRFASDHGNVEPPRNAEAWNMIESGQGATEQHRLYLQGKHDFDWCDETMEYVCFFCLMVHPIVRTL